MVRRVAPAHVDGGHMGKSTSMVIVDFSGVDHSRIHVLRKVTKHQIIGAFKIVQLSRSRSTAIHTETDGLGTADLGRQ